MSNILDVSIVLYKTDATCLERLIKSIMLCDKVGDIYLIDNSPSNSLSYFGDYFQKIVYRKTSGNLGFGAGHNIVLTEAIKKRNKYHLVINPDVYFDSDVLTNLLGFMDSNHNVGLVMPKILYPDRSLQHTCKLLPTPFDLILRRFLPKFLIFKNMANRFELRASGYDHQMEVPYLSGCFMFLRVEALSEIGIFDERFFMYPEDIDLSRRMYRKFKNIFYPEVFVYHEHGRASYKNFRMLIIHIVNIIKYFNKWGWFFDDERKLINLKILSDEKIK